MKIKRILATLLVACMIFSILPASVLADDSGRMCFDSNVNVDAGGNVTFDLNVENNPGFASLSVRIFYKSLTCEWIDCYVDKNSENTVYGAATTTYAAEIRRSQISAAIDSNVNDTANIPKERADAGWQMASIGFIFQDKDKNYAANPRMLSADGAMASLNFSASADMETQDVAIEVEILKATDNNNENVAIAGSTSKIHINGAAPTIDTIKLTKTTESGEEEKYTSEFASGETFNLNVTSKNGTPITDLVSFEVTSTSEDYTPNYGFTFNGSSMTVVDIGAAPAGTYTITAKPQTGSDACKGEASATFTITPKKIASPIDVEVTGFVKGQTVNTVTASAPAGLHAACTWYTGTGDVSEKTPLADTDKFSASTDYTLVLTLSAENSNYELEEGASVTVTGVGESQTGTLDAENKITVTGTTGDKDPTKLKLGTQLYVASSTKITYGMKLSEVPIFTDEAVAVAYVNGKEGEVVTGSYSWATLDAPVGNAGQNRAEAVFTPSEEYADRYVGFTMWLRYYVSPKRITLDDKNVVWSKTNLTYNGDEQTVTLTTPGIEGDVDVAYDYEEGHTNKATNVGSYTAVAILTPKNAGNVVFADDGATSRTYTTSWMINNADLHPQPAEKKVAFGAEQDVVVTPADFGLTQAGVELEVIQAGNTLITGFFSDKSSSATLRLRATSKADVNTTTDTATLKFYLANYNEVTATLTVKIIDKTTNSSTLQITLNAENNTYTYGDTVTPSVGNTKPADAGDVEYKYFKVVDGNETEVKDQPFDVGTYKVTAKCESASTIYTAEKTFTVVAREIKAENVTFGSPNLVYTGGQQTQTVIVTINGTTLTAGTDYTADPSGVNGETKTSENSMSLIIPGTYTVTVKGNGNYSGEVTVTFEVAKAPLSSVSIGSILLEYDYTGEAQEPEPALTFVKATGEDETLVSGTDYTLSYEDNINVGTATITITATKTSEHFTGTTTKTFKITPVSVVSSAGKITVKAIPNQVYNAQPQEPAVTVEFGDRTLVKGTDYTVVYDNNTNASSGTAASATITGIGNFTGTRLVYFIINPANLNLSNKNFTHVYTDNVNQTYTVPADMFLAAEKEENKGFTIKETSLTYAVTAGEDVLTGKPTVSGNTISYTLKGTPDALGTVAVEVPIHATCGNYNDGTFLLIITVTDKSDVTGSISFPDGSAVYTGTGIKYENATISGYSGTLRYGYTPNASTGASLDASGLPLTVGTYTVAVTFNSDASFGYKTATFTITKATPTGTPGYTKLESSGKTLADAKLTVGTIRPAGTIAWDLPLTTVLEDGKAYAWTFTPADTHNYTILTGTLIPYVDDGMDYIPGVIGGNTGSFNFHDVSRLDYFYDAVKWAAENGIASGTGRYTFSPNAVCTRAQTVTFLWRAAGSPLPRYRVCPFTDVQPSDYYYNAVLWAVEQGITTGLNATTFGPDVTVTRGQVATFLYRAASAAKPNTFNPFTDVKTTAYNYNAILWAYDNRITTGTSDTTFSPDAYCTRAQIVTFLYRYYQGR